MAVHGWFISPTYYSRYPVWYTFWPIRMFRPGMSRALRGGFVAPSARVAQRPAGTGEFSCDSCCASTDFGCYGLSFGLGLTCSVLFQKYIWYIGKKGWDKETLQEVPIVSAVTRFFHHRNQAALLVDHYLLPGPQHTLMGNECWPSSRFFTDGSKAIRMKVNFVVTSCLFKAISCQQGVCSRHKTMDHQHGQWLHLNCTSSLTCLTWKAHILSCSAWH